MVAGKGNREGSTLFLPTNIEAMTDNAKKVLDYLFLKERATMRGIAHEVDISRITALACVNYLVKTGHARKVRVKRSILYYPVLKDDPSQLKLF